MTKQYDDTNSGAIWKNERRESEKQPLVRGESNIICQHCGERNDFRSAGWKPKTDHPKAPIMSFKYEPLEQQSKTKAEPEQPSFDDDLPF